MAERRVLSFIIDLKDRASRGFKSFGTALKATFRSITRVVTLGTAAIVAYTAALGALALQGGKVLGVQRAFILVTGDLTGSLAKLRAASRGLISDFELMAGFNRALTLGAADTVEQFGELTEVALTLGRALGVDAAFAMESLSLGIGRQSRLFLDNLGLIVRLEQAYEDYAKEIGVATSELTEQEKAIGFRNAAMDAAREKIAQLGGIEENAADSVTRFKVALKNARDEIALVVAQSPLLETFFNRLSLIVDQTVRVFLAGIPAIKLVAGELGIVAGNALAAGFLKSLLALDEIITRTIFPEWLANLLLINTGIRKELGDAADAAVVQLEAALARVQNILDNLPERDGDPTSVTTVDNLVVVLSLWKLVGIEMEKILGTADSLAKVIAGTLVDGMLVFSAAMSAGLAEWIAGTKTLGQALKGAFLGALSSIAAGFARFYAAQAAAAIAAGLLGDPRGFAAAAKYTAAAVLMGTIAGVAAIGAGGGGGVGVTAIGFEDELSGTGRVAGGTIIIQGGILDMSDPRQADALAGAIEDLGGMRRGSIIVTTQ